MKFWAAMSLILGLSVFGCQDSADSAAPAPAPSATTPAEDATPPAEDDTPPAEDDTTPPA